MRKIILMSHGELAKGALNTLSIFSDFSQNVTAISAYVNDCDPKTELEKFWLKVKEGDQVIIFTDIAGGSVNTLAMPYLSRPNTYLFSGFNMAMLLQLICLDENAPEQEIKELANVGRESIFCMNDYQFEAFGEDDE